MIATELTSARATGTASVRDRVSGAAPKATPAQRAIAAAMNGVDPDPVDAASLSGVKVTERLIHLATSAALRDVLMSRPSGIGGRVRAHRRAWGTEKAGRDAYNLALALAEHTDGNSEPLHEILHRGGWIDAALLVSRLQIRFLGKICRQVEARSEIVTEFESVSNRLAGELARSGEPVAPGMTLLPDMTRRDPEDTSEGGWCRATSTITIEGRPMPVIVDAGPSSLPATWSVWVAAPMKLTAVSGSWPIEAVRDCLEMCDTGVLRWSESMNRHFTRAENPDVQMRWTAAPDRFLLAPAAATIISAAGGHTRRDTGAAPAGMDARRDEVVPIDAREVTSPPREEARELLMTMRDTEIGRRLGSDDVLTAAIDVLELRHGEMELLGVTEPDELAEEATVTVEIDLPDHLDHHELIHRWREAGGVRTRAALVGWLNQDVVQGKNRRLAVTARVHRGIPVRVRGRDALILPSGTELTVLGSDSSKFHSTLYAVQDDAAATSDPSGGRDTSRPACVSPLFALDPESADAA